MTPPRVLLATGWVETTGDQRRPAPRRRHDPSRRHRPGPDRRTVLADTVDRNPQTRPGGRPGRPRHRLGRPVRRRRPVHASTTEATRNLGRPGRRDRRHPRAPRRHRRRPRDGQPPPRTRFRRRSSVETCHEHRRRVEARPATVDLRRALRRTGPTDGRRRTIFGQGDDIAIVVDIATTATADVLTWVRETGAPVRELVTLAPPSGTPKDNAITRRVHGRRLRGRDARRSARLRGSCAQIHLFMAAPLGLALLIGHRWNRVGLTHVYEDLQPGYERAFTISA